MRVSDTTRYGFAIVFGILVLVSGILLIDDQLKSICGLCIGIGAGLASMYSAKLMIHLYYEKHPALKKQSDINSKDERTITITNKAKAKAFDIMTKLLMIIPFLLILLDVSLWMILATIVLYLFGFFVQIYCTVKYSKVM